MDELGLPGGPATAEAVSGAGLSVQGFGQVQFAGEFGTKVVNFSSPHAWQRLVADRDEVLPSGGELGAILRLLRCRVGRHSEVQPGKSQDVSPQPRRESGCQAYFDC